MPGGNLLYILYGEDDFSIREALAKIKEGLGDKELLSTNTTIFQGQNLTLQQLITTCDTLPFLAPNRLVIVEGLLSRFETQDKEKRAAKPRDSEWQSFKEYLNRMPGSTVLILADGALKRSNPMLVDVAPLAKVQEFKPLKGVQLRNWMQARAKDLGCSISPPALQLLSELVGGNLGLLSIEIDKLCLYAQGRMVEVNDVKSLVAYAQETNVFSMVDAILERNASKATRLLHLLEDEGAAPAYLLFMITRQIRMVIQAKDMLQQKQAFADIGHTLGISSDFVLQKVREQARAPSMEQLKSVYRKLLDTDISIKTGRIKGDRGELALELLICELCEGYPPPK
jgi:DNA polymerase III subunit delta